MKKLRKVLHKKFDIHHWQEHTDGGQVDKRRCQICGRIDWFNFFTLEWFEKVPGAIV